MLRRLQRDCGDAGAYVLAALAGFAGVPNTGPVKVIWRGEQERSHRVDCLVICLVNSRTKKLSSRSTSGLYIHGVPTTQRQKCLEREDVRKRVGVEL